MVEAAEAVVETKAEETALPLALAPSLPPFCFCCLAAATLCRERSYGKEKEVWR
jgi:hypothetical protein